MIFLPAFLPPFLCTLFGTTLLYLSWRRTAPDRRTASGIGWLFLIGSLALWVIAAGPEYAPVFTLLTVPFVAWLFIAFGRQDRVRTTTTLTRRGLHGPSLRSVLSNAGLFVAAVPLAGLVASLVSAALIRWMPGLDVDRMVFAVLFMPVLWGSFAVWICADPRRMRAVSLVTGLGIVSGLLASVP